MIFASADHDQTDIIKYFGDQAIKVPIAYGDFAFWSGGEGEDALSISIERKRIGDLVSSITNGHLVQQIRNARETHQVIYVIVEGLWRPSSEGLLEYMRGSGWAKMREYHQPGSQFMRYERIDNALTSLMHCEGVHIKRTSGPKETARVVMNLYHWWQTPPDKHTTGHIFPLVAGGSMSLVGQFSLRRRMAKELPGIGWELSERVEKHFSSVLEMVVADVSEWEKIEGIGKKKALDAVAEMEGQG